MATAYSYIGEDERDYPTLGAHVAPGDILYLDGRPPDGRFRALESGQEAPPAVTLAHTATPMRRPNLAASKADWQLYALSQGMPPDEVEVATRKEIIEHFCGAGSDTNPDDTED